ncbi:MAG: ATP-binding protein [Bacteroidota bacterium]|nr:ATP-binding protein [Bacteroidota bacterium]
MENILYRYNPWWENDFNSEYLIEREGLVSSLINEFGNNQIVILTGLRRVGKTSMLKLIIKKLIESNYNPKQIFYLSMDEYLLKDSNILEIIEAYRKLQKLKTKEKIYLFLDEITFKKDFEIQLKNLYDNQNVKIFASSSNSAILEDKKAMLTGRTINYEILPLTYNEYLIFKKINIKKTDNHLHESYFLEYLKTGGIPEFVLTDNFEYLKNLINDIIYKDIAAIHNVRDISILQDFFLLLMERTGKKLSINKIASILSISSDTAHRYLNYFSRTYLIHLVKKAGKTNERILSANKIYAADIGIRNYFTGFRDKGSIFENYVFLRIKHLNPSYIYKNKIEIDFITENKTLIEAKFHKEKLSDKQQKLFDETDANKKYIVRNDSDITKLLLG